MFNELLGIWWGGSGMGGVEGGCGDGGGGEWVGGRLDDIIVILLLCICNANHVSRLATGYYYWTSWRLKTGPQITNISTICSTAYLANEKETSELHNEDPYWRESIGNRWIPFKKGQ